MKKFIWVLLSLLAVLYQLNGYRKVGITTPYGEVFLPLKDKKRIEYLFRELIIYHAAGYTLLGNKPVSFECVSKPVCKMDLLLLWHTFFPSNLKRYYAWKTWQKYEHLFNKGNFLIWSEPSPWIENGELIVIANNHQVKQILQKHERDFALLKNLETKVLFKESLQSHDGLLGILLGYGRTNSWLFYEKKNAQLKSAFSDEINQLFENKKSALNFTLGWPIVGMAEILMYPTFMADTNTEETKKLKSDYLDTREKILDYYKDKDFLEATLQLLAK